MVEECSICLDAIVVDTTGRVEMSGCHHAFHLGCIAKWLVKQDHCPNCRNIVSDKETNIVECVSDIRWPIQMGARETMEWMQDMLRQNGLGEIQVDESHQNINNNAAMESSQTNRDIELIMSHLSVPRNVATESLQQNRGDVVNAILYLSIAEEVD